MNFQIAVACLLDANIRISFIYTSSCICLGTSCSWINFSFECVKSEYNVGPCSRTHSLKCSNTTQGVAEVFVILNLGMEE